MIKEIQYQGYATEPSDYECPDGQLATSLNLISEDNQLKPIFQPKPLATYENGDRVIFVHNTSVFKHYIKLSADGKKLSWIDSEDMAFEDALHSFTGKTKAYKINAVGNTLCVLCNDGIHYILWKAETTGYYKYLGTQPPFIQLCFGLSTNYGASYDRGTIETTDTSKTYQSAWRMTAYNATDCLEINSTKTAVSFKDKHIEELQGSIWALINQTNALITKEGHFYAPFFVRYCYRMYDGTQWMHSAPVFMPVSMPNAYQVEIPNVFSSISDNNISSIVNNLDVIEENGSSSDFKLTKLGFRYRPHNVALRCRAINSGLDVLKSEWGDIVKSIDVFVSLPVIREDSAEKIKTASKANPSYHVVGGQLEKHTYPWRLKSDADKINDVICDIPLLSDEAYLDKVRSVSSFYKVHSYSLESDNIPMGYMTEVPINKSALPVLATQEVMTDDYKTHNKLLPAFNKDGACVTSLYNYNGRQNISGVKEKLFGGFSLRHLLCAVNGGSQGNQHVYVYLNTEDGERVVDCFSELQLSPQDVNLPMLYNCPIFYPDNRAVRMEVQYGNKLVVLKMEACPLLNGAFTIGGIMNSLDTSFTQKEYAAPVLSDIVDVSNKIYTSEINNPFFFPVTGINSVGTGHIYGICSAAKALSQGQFGQFPLYAFTTEGVWALEVSYTGGYSAKQPITRDVCVNPDSITQLDSAVLFPSARGIMLISGSQTQCISDNIFAEVPFDVTTLPSMQQLHAMLGDTHAADACVPVKPFLDFLAGCKMVYDYVHQRIIVYNPTLDADSRPLYTYAYVYSLKSQRWGMMYSDLASSLNSYPDALAMTHDNRLVSFSDTDETECHALYVTRPLKLDAADVHKTISTIIQRGHFRRGDVATVLYGSRDLYTWRLVWSSKDHYLRGFRGTPYKYFRIAGMAKLTDGKSISGASVNFEPRHNNQLR